MSKTKGFTLVEALITIAIFTLAMGAVVGFIVMGYRTQSYSLQQSTAISEARKGIETMIKEIREGRDAEDGAYIIEKTEDYKFTFYSDIDKDSEIEKVSYSVDETDFKKEVIDPVINFDETPPITYPEGSGNISILSQYVRNIPPIFRYFNGDGNEIEEYPARKVDTKLMKVQLVINVDPNRSPQDFILGSEIQVRNLKTNL